ncbi:hypothetical protein MSIMFI_00205 [Mycobacterium simulans]|nr:hypothetical protein MSIMFI_00205 [Mycobacterium simulans]
MSYVLADLDMLAAVTCQEPGPRTREDLAPGFLFVVYASIASGCGPRGSYADIAEPRRAYRLAHSVADEAIRLGRALRRATFSHRDLGAGVWSKPQIV